MKWADEYVATVTEILLAWRFKSSRMWCCVVGWVVHSISKIIFLPSSGSRSPRRYIFSSYGLSALEGLSLHICWCFTITLFRHTTLGRTPLDEWSARRRDLYLTTHNRQTSMPLVGFKPTIPASEQPQTHALDRAATGIGPRRYGPSKC
jgi:hypothetical protein